MCFLSTWRTCSMYILKVHATRSDSGNSTRTQRAPLQPRLARCALITSKKRGAGVSSITFHHTSGNYILQTSNKR